MPHRARAAVTGLLLLLGAAAAMAPTSAAGAESPASDAPKVDETALRHILPAFDLRLDVVRPPTAFGTGRLWHVGPNESFKKLSDVVGQVHDGDIIEIDAAHYACDTGVKWSANYLTLVGVGGRPVLDATNCGGVVGDKGILNPRGDNVIIDNIEFVGASGPSANDAGIRYDGSGYLYITNSFFHDNQNGILVTPANPAATDIVIDHSEFAHNGTDGGRTHNIYISGGSAMTHSFVIRFSYSHNAYIGHEVKTRALTNYILYNRLADEDDGNSSYEIDISQGGLTYIIGNVMEKGARADNAAFVSYAAEEPFNPVQEVYIVNNTFVADTSGPTTAVNLYDHGLSAAKMINNLVAGERPPSLVGVAPGKMELANNVVTAVPGFYDAAHREYHLTADSEAVHAGTDPGSAQGIPLVPAFEFAYPASGVPRPRTGVLDAGAYQYQPGQKIPPPPTVELTGKSPVDYGGAAVLNWSSTGALYCSASGDWSGALDHAGTYRSPALTSRKSYAISCAGPGGSTSRSVTIDVNQSPEAAALGSYEWREIPNSALLSVCASQLRGATGEFAYKDDFGTGPYCESKGNGATGIYVPPMQTWYLLGGAGGRNYYGNEVYGFNLATLKPELVTLPDHIGETKEYAPEDAYNSKVHLAACDAALHLQDGTIIPSPDQVTGTAAWSPELKQIVVGPGTFRGGSSNCAANGEAGQMTTSIWGFTPPDSARLPARSSEAWHLLAGANNAFGSVTTPLWFLDPTTGLMYIAGGRNYPDRGGFLVDPTQHPVTSALANGTWPYGADIIGASAVDTDHHYALILGNHSFAMWDLNGLSLAKYGAGKPFLHESGWSAAGDADLFSDPRDPGLTYNPKLKAFVAWTGDPVVYFLYPDYEKRKLKIVAKMDIANGPTETVNDLDGKFVYIPDKDVYLAFTGVEKNFYLLVPPQAAKSQD